MASTKERTTMSTKELIESAARNFVEEVSALARLKVVVRLTLRGRGEEQVWRLDLPGVTAKKDPAADAKVEVSVPRTHFNELAKDGRLTQWRDAYEHGYIRVSGQEQILQLIARVIERHEQREKLKKRRTPS